MSIDTNPCNDLRFLLSLKENISSLESHDNTNIRKCMHRYNVTFWATFIPCMVSKHMFLLADCFARGQNALDHILGRASDIGIEYAHEGHTRMHMAGIPWPIQYEAMKLHYQQLLDATKVHKEGVSSLRCWMMRKIYLNVFFILKFLFFLRPIPAFLIYHIDRLMPERRNKHWVDR